MTDQETREEQDRIVREKYPLIASRFIDKEIMLKAAKEKSFEVSEWRGKYFPYQTLHQDFKDLIRLQYIEQKADASFIMITEQEVVEFLNWFYRWKIEEENREGKELSDNQFELTQVDKADLLQFAKESPIPRREPLSIREYLHMCRIAYDAAPKFPYPEFISDLYVVGQAKLDSCGLTYKNFNIMMEPGDQYPKFMYYHPEEMGFGGPYVRFEWFGEDNKDGWVMYFWDEERGDQRKKNMSAKRFLAMRRAGYPVIWVSNEGRISK